MTGLENSFLMTPEKWEKFKKHYLEELRKKEEHIQKLLGKANKTYLTLLYTAQEENFNNARVLKEYLESRLKI